MDFAISEEQVLEGFSWICKICCIADGNDFKRIDMRATMPRYDNAIWN